MIGLRERIARWFCELSEGKLADRYKPNADDYQMADEVLALLRERPEPVARVSTTGLERLRNGEAVVCHPPNDRRVSPEWPALFVEPVGVRAPESEREERVGLICMWCHRFESDMDCASAPHGHHTFIDGDTLASEDAANDAELARLRAPVDPPEPNSVMQDDMAALMEVLGISTHARNASPHEVMRDEIIPAVRALVDPPERVSEPVPEDSGKGEVLGYVVVETHTDPTGHVHATFVYGDDGTENQQIMTRARAEERADGLATEAFDASEPATFGGISYAVAPVGGSKEVERVSEASALREALERIIGMCDVPDRCRCGRPRGIAAVVACARRALEDTKGERDDG